MEKTLLFDFVILTNSFMVNAYMVRQTQKGYIQNGDIILIWDNDEREFTAKYIGKKTAINLGDEPLLFAVGYSEYNGLIFVEEVIDIKETDEFLETKVKMNG